MKRVAWSIFCAALVAVGSAQTLTQISNAPNTVLPGEGCEQMDLYNEYGRVGYFGTVSGSYQESIIDGSVPFDSAYQIQRVGLSEGANPACGSQQAGLITPCTELFNVVEVKDTLFAYPDMNIVQGAAPNCTVSRCQGFVGKINGDTINGVAYSRGTADQTFNVTATKNRADGTVTLDIAPPGLPFSCPLDYQIVATTGTETSGASSGVSLAACVSWVWWTMVVTMLIHVGTSLDFPILKFHRSD